MFDWLKEKRAPDPRRGMPSPRLSEHEFKRRFRSQFRDRNFASLEPELEKITQAAWDAYAHSRKSPRTRKAGRSSPIRIMICQKIGLPLTRPSRLRNAATKTRSFPPACF